MNDLSNMTEGLLLHIMKFLLIDYNVMVKP